MRIAIGADHNGIAIKARLVERLSAAGHQLDDRGAHGADTVDYPPLCEDVCRQVLYHQQLAREQQERIGPERFWIVDYEAFCRNPSVLVEAVANKVLGQPCPDDARQLSPFTISNSVRIDPPQFHEIETTLERLASSAPPLYVPAV